MTREEALRRIHRAAEENLTELDLAGLELEELPPEIGKCTQLETLLLGKLDEEKEEWVGNKLTEFPDVVFQLTNLKILSIANNQIAVIPEAIAQLSNLTHIDLMINQITVIPEAIGQLSHLTQLVLISNQITVIPEAIAQLSNLTQLNLSNNQIKVIPEDLAQLSNLTQLVLISNQIAVIPEAIGQLSNLTHINLNRNQITVIPEALAQLSNLTQLSLGSNQITVIPEAIGQLSNLTLLELRHNQIAVIPEAIAQLSNLTQLYLSANQIAVIPEAIAQLSNLTHINLSINQITVIPEALAQLSNLTHLDLGNNQIAQVPDALTKLCEALVQMPNLTRLNLSGNQIAQVPEALAKLYESLVQLPNLKELDLSDNQIIQVPDGLAKLCTMLIQLPNLTQLRLRKNQITQVPDGLTKLCEALVQMSNLTELNLNDNQITKIPAVISHLSNLTSLSLWNNQIAEIPEVLGRLSHLTQLDLDSNQITQIPEVIAQLSNLTWLDLRNNQISEISEVIAQLSNLTMLHLDNNQITVIPEAIAQLSNLTRLDLRNNQIEKIPECLETLAKLETLDLRHNPLPISPEVLGNKDKPGTPAAIFNYLQKLRSGEVLPLNEAKVLLVGQGNVGKTSLINRLICDKYNPNESQTDGLNITDWQITVNTKSVKLNVWDFGGQEIYHATHQFFLTKRSLYVLVCNCRTSEDENRLEYWLKLIESFGDASPVIIVGNKCDEQPLDLNRKALRDKYPNIKAILETSCEKGTGIEELRSAIHTEISQLKEVYDLLPLSWFQVKQSLETLDKDFINMSEYASICCKQNIWEETDKTQLLELLHNLGIVLNFREHPILQSTNILNPHWVTEGIYALLSDEELKVKTKGILTHDDLSRILDSHKYPRHRYNCLTELMGEFQLCFPVRDCREKTFLIPGILPKEEPENTELKGETLEFQYHYDILPDSIVSRFIVLMHDKIHEKIHWRTGVMLAYCEGADVCNIARIKSDPKDQKIFIAVSGRESTRRSFLTIIRDTFSKIHNSFANLEVSQWVPVPGYPDAEPLDYDELLGLEDMGENTVRVGKLKLKLDLRQLLDGYEAIEVRRNKGKGDEKYGREYDDIVDIAKLAVSRPINNKAEVNMTQDSSQTNNLQGAQIGNFAKEVKDSAQLTASGFTQNNNANTAELLKLISSMRETATQFPEEIRDGIILDIEAVEAEIQKPEKERDNPRLKTILKRIVATGLAIGIGVAGVTDFASSAIDLSNKLGVKIELPSAK